MRSSHVTLSVLHLSGAVTRVDVTVEEYDRVFQEWYLSRRELFTLAGTGAEGLPFHIKVGEAIAIWADGGQDAPNPLETAFVQATFTWRTGATTSFSIFRPAYERIATGVSEMTTFVGTSANGRRYRLETALIIGITAEPVGGESDKRPLSR